MNIRNVVLFIMPFLLLSCASTTRLMDSWKSQDFDNVVHSKILVITKTPEPDIRKSFEIAIAKRLRAKKMDAIESYLQFPLLVESKTIEDKQRIVQQLKKAGIYGVIITSLKQIIETQNESKGSHTNVSTTYGDRKSFEPDALNLNPTEIATSKTYILEVLTYNLALESDKQLVNACLVDVTDPDSLDKIQKTFTKIIGDQFK